MRPMQARVALARHACRLAFSLLQTRHPFDEEQYARARKRGRSLDGATCLPPARAAAPHGAHENLPHDGA